MIVTPDQDRLDAWILCSHKAGELAQQQALAQALRISYASKTLHYRKLRFPAELVRQTGLHGLNAQSRKQLSPPWPRLLISAGVRSEPVARWIKEQSQGYSRIIHIGRNWADYRHFDLIITTPQYRLPERSNILHNRMTLHSVNRDNLRKARADWQQQYDHEQTPAIAVLVGGHSGPFSFGIHAARRLASELNRLADLRQAKLLISTSARTPHASQQALRQALSRDHEFFRWSLEAKTNPYLAYIGIASEIVVTGDSIAMLSEAVASGKPVHIFDSGIGKGAMRRNHTPDPGQKNDFRLGAHLYGAMMRWAPARLSRDIRLVHDWLIANQYAVWLQPPYPQSAKQAPDEMHSTVEHIRHLLSENPPAQ